MVLTCLIGVREELGGARRREKGGPIVRWGGVNGGCASQWAVVAMRGGAEAKTRPPEHRDGSGWL